jgi:hypothetical protein
MVGQQKKNIFGLFFYLSSPLIFFSYMKSTPIYRGWKRDIWSFLDMNLGSWFKWEGSQPILAKNHYHELSWLVGSTYLDQLCKYILSEESNGKDLNHWLKITIMKNQSNFSPVKFQKHPLIPTCLSSRSLVLNILNFILNWLSNF